jgi:hypothetical protein
VTFRTYVFGIAAAVFVLLVVVTLLRRRRLRERHAAWWLFAGTLALLLSAFPAALTYVANLVGFLLPLNLVFFMSIAILFLVSIQQSSELTGLESKTRDLAETVSLLQMRVDELSRGAVHLPDDSGELPDPHPDHER